MIDRLLVLGGGSEIATAFVRRCAADPDGGLSRVVLAGRTHSRSLAAAHAGLVADFPTLEAEIAAFDAAATGDHVGVLREIDERHGPFDTVLIAFGDLGPPFTIDLDPAEAAAIAHLNFTAAVSSCLASLDILRGEPDARLIVLSSIAAVRPRIGNVVYASAKAGLDAFALELAAPARAVGVEVVVVRPGFVHTAMTEGLEPAPFAATADEVGAEMHEGIVEGKTVIHCPAVLGAVGFVFKNLPRPIWRRISAR